MKSFLMICRRTLVTLVVSVRRHIIDIFYFVWYNINMKKRFNFEQLSDVTHGRGYVYSLKYHIVWCTKYRKSVLVNEIASRVSEYLRETAATLEMEILAMEVMPDHIHLLVACKPQNRLSDSIKVLKGNSARWLFMQFPDIKHSMWGGHLWNPSYYVSTVSDRNEDQIRHYIETQKTK